MGIQWQETDGVPKVQGTFSAQVNLVMTGSKKLETREEKTAAFADQPQQVRIRIVDAEDETKVLIDEIVEPSEFSTGSIGYTLRETGVSFNA